MSKTHILVVEDKSIVAKDIQRSLQDLGYIVPAVVSSGEEAVKKAEENKPDLVLMDIILRDQMDGIEAANEIRKRFDIPIVYLTAYADEKILERAKITVPYGYILKPYEDRELHTNIEMALYKHRMEKKLKENEEWLSTTLNSIGDAVIATDTEGRVRFMNHVAQFLTGWTQEEVIGKPLEDVFNIVSEDTGEKIENPVTKVIREGIVAKLVNNTGLITKDGKKLPIDDSGAPIKDDEGNIIGVVLIFRDITERRQMKKVLRESEEKYRLIFENAEEGISIHEELPDGGRKLVDCNPRYVEMSGYSREELMQIGDTQKIQKNLNTPQQKAVNNERFLAGQPYSGIFSWIRPDGKENYIEYTAAPFTIGGRKFTVGIDHDVTERKKMEAERQKIQRLESIAILAGGIAHDFNNLLTGILGNISLAKMYSSEEKVIERLTEAEKASLRAKDLTQQLLTFSTGGTPIKETTSIPELLKDTAEFVLAGSNVKCEFSIPDDLWTVEIDKGQISQVINNLIINADQSMPKGGIIQIRAENVNISAEDNLPLKDGKYVKISIEDHGTGISKEHLPKIFDPYWTTKGLSSQKGTGLGLAIAHSIVKNHDGHITVKSVLGVGTTVYIYFPASQKQILTKKDTKERPIVHKGKILLMDDEKIIRDVAGDMLKYIGYEVDFANEGTSAIELYKKAKESGQPFDIVILDLTVSGGMGGKEAIKRLLEIDSEVKAIVSSGYSNDPIMFNFRQYGFSGVIAKPYKINELSEILHTIMQ